MSSQKQCHRARAGVRIGPYRLHRREQWDLECFPILCIHKSYDHGNGSRRVLCIYIRDHELRIRRSTISGSVSPGWSADRPGGGSGRRGRGRGRSQRETV